MYAGEKGLEVKGLMGASYIKERFQREGSALSLKKEEEDRVRGGGGG